LKCAKKKGDEEDEGHEEEEGEEKQEKITYVLITLV
jgi:hypothetical protein